MDFAKGLSIKTMSPLAANRLLKNSQDRDFVILSAAYNLVFSAVEILHFVQDDMKD